MDPPSLRKYGVPIYAVGWNPNGDIDSDDCEGSQLYPVLAGGGGEGRSGIPNAVLVSSFNLRSNSLSEQPIGRISLGSDLPYRMAVHPGGDGVLCALPNRCKFFEWDKTKEETTTSVSLKESEISLPKLENIEQQLSLAFDGDSQVLACGGENGKLRVFKWPSMESIIEEDDVHPSVKDLCFSLDGKLLVSLGRSAGKVWDLSSSKTVATLPKESDEAFVSCRFSQTQENNCVLYIATIKGASGCIQSWNATSWEKISSKKIPCESVSSFDASHDGRLLAIGTADGSVMIMSTETVRVLSVIKKAHIGIVTALAFSKDSRNLVSASMDSSARVTKIEALKTEGGRMTLWMIIVAVLLVFVAYVFMNKRLP